MISEADEVEKKVKIIIEVRFSLTSPGKNSFNVISCTTAYCSKVDIFSNHYHIFQSISLGIDVSSSAASSAASVQIPSSAAARVSSYA